MLKEAIAYLVSLIEAKTFVINGDTYADKELTYIPSTHIDYAQTLQVNGLDSIVKLVKVELEKSLNCPVFIRVDSPRKVEVFDALDDHMSRNRAYEAICDAPDFRAGWREHEAAIIELRSAFIPNQGTEYLLDLLSRICKDESVISEDNGVSQTVRARKGIGLKQVEQLKTRVSLIPYRSFAEIEQPESEFILRMDNDTRIGLFEADGGRWKMAAKERIKAYFEQQLAKEVENGRVIVMM